MNIETIRNMVLEDFKINDSELDTESLRIPQLHNKYLNFFHDEKINLSTLRHRYRILKKEKWEYYTGKMDTDTLTEKGWEPFDLKILKQDVGLYIDSDHEIIYLESKLVQQEEKVNYLESIVKQINNLQWHIRDAIAWRKFVNGIN